MKVSNRAGLAALAIASLPGLAGCSHTVSRQVDDTGQAAEIIFPRIEANTWVREGSFPSLERLRGVQVGMTKNQLMDALGHPHFAEGLWGVREWDYLFNLRAADGSTRRCQFKVLFDKDMVARGLYTLPQDCIG